RRGNAKTVARRLRGSASLRDEKLPRRWPRKLACILKTAPLMPRKHDAFSAGRAVRPVPVRPESVTKSRQVAQAREEHDADARHTLRPARRSPPCQRPARRAPLRLRELQPPSTGDRGDLRREHLRPRRDEGAHAPGG